MNSHFSPMAVLLIRWTALLALAWALHTLVRNRHPRWRLILWRSVFCFIVMMPFARLPTFNIPLGAAVKGIDRMVIQSVSATPVSPAPTLTSTAASPARPVPSKEGVRTAASTPSAAAPWRVPWRALAVSVWSVGAIWAGSRLVRFQIILNRLRAQSQPAPEPLQKRARDIAAGLKVSRRFAVRVSGVSTSPFAAGLFRPVVLLPGKLIDGLPEEEMTVLMAHETAHFRRGDLFWCIAWRWIEALCWPHPLIWAVPAAHNLACEEEADRVASGWLRDGEQYSQLLARLALRVLDLPRLETKLALNAVSHIARRLEKLKKNPAKLWGWKNSAAGFALVGGLFLVTAACGFSSDEPPAADAQSNGAYEPANGFLTEASNQLALISTNQALVIEKMRAQASNQMAVGFFIRASSRAVLGEFQDAAADFEHGIQINPSNHMAWFCLTSLLIQNGDIAKYRTGCKEMLRRFSDTTDGSAAERVAKCCLWVPGALDPRDSALAAKLADNSVALSQDGEFWPWRRMAKGLAEYRQGQFKNASETIDLLLKEMDDAEQSGRKTPSFDTCQADVCFISAMAHRQLQEMDDASVALHHGHEIVWTRLPPLESKNLGGDWMNILMTYALQSEANKTVGVMDQFESHFVVTQPPASQVGAGNKAKADGVTPTAAADLSKIPHSYQFGDGDRLRVWKRIDDQTWHEVYPDGFTSVFKVAGRANVGQTEGTVVAKVAGDPARTGTPNNGTLQAFIPDKDSAVMHHLWRFLPGGDNWFDLGQMRDVQ